MTMGQLAFAAAAVLVVAAIACGMTAYFSLFRIWFKAHQAGAAVTVGELVGVFVRRGNPRQLADARIAAKEAGLDVSMAQFEQVQRSGRDVSSVVEELAAAKKADTNDSFAAAAVRILESAGWSRD